MKTFYYPQLMARVTLLAVFLQINFVFAEQAPVNQPRTLTSVSRLISSNLINHPDLSAIKADLQSAKSALRAADNALYNPEMEIEYEETDIKTKSIGIRQTIDWGDQQGSRTAVAREKLNKAIASYDMAVQSLIKNHLSHLANNQTGQELIQLSNEALRLMQEFKEIAKRRYQAGDLNQVELNLAQLAYSQVLMEQANIQAEATSAQEKLHALFSNLSSELPQLPEFLPEPKLNSDLDIFLQTLPVVRGQLAETNIARQIINLRKSEKAWNPTIGLSAGSEGDEDLIGFNLSIPLNIRNNYSAEVDAAQQALIASEQRAHLAFRNTRANLLTTFERYRGLLKAWNSWREQSRDSVEQQLILIKKLWHAGDISASDYLLQLKQALDTQATGLKLRNQLWQVAFEWMSLTNHLDDWLKIKIELSGKN